MSAVVVDYDPLKDKAYQQTRLGRSVVDFLAWKRIALAAERTLDQYERDLARGALMFPSKGLKELADGDAIQIAGQYHDAERRVRVAAWRSFYKWAVRTRQVDRSPFDALPEIRRKPQKVADVFTEPEVEALLSLELVDAAPLAVLFDAGLRKAEGRSLQLRHCLPERNQVVVFSGKGGKDRIVPMSSRLRSLIADLAIIEGLGPSSHIFYATRANQRARRIIRDKPIGEGTFARWWAGCLDRAGVRYRSPHTARHTFATAWRRRGLSIDELQILLGHSSIRTTADLYVHTNVHDVAEHMALIEASESPEHSL